MSNKWIKLRAGIDQHLSFFMLCELMDCDYETALFRLYKLASYLSVHGKYGNLEEDYRSVVNNRFGGLVDGLIAVDWCKIENGWMMFSGFTDAHTERKSLGKKIRREVLRPGECVVCASTISLEVDHDIPISRGGTSDIGNLLCMCKRCNASKGTKTLQEFVEAAK